MFFGILAGRPAPAADIGYPAPPGAYRSETGQLPDLTAPAPAMRPGNTADDQAASNTGSRLLPLPEEDTFGRQSDRYGAGNLFGTQTPTQPPPPDVRNAPPASPAGEPISWRSGAANRQTGPDRKYSDFSRDFDRGTRGRQIAPGHQEPEGAPYRTNPRYLKSFPGYPQQGGYDPGRRMGGAPASKASGYPQEQAATTGTATATRPFQADGVTDRAAPAASSESTVFRPTN